MSRFHNYAVVALLLLSGGLAMASLVGDSITFDELSHLTSGFSYLKTGDFRLAPDHPPLAKMWAALPVLFQHPLWDAQPEAAWKAGDVWLIGLRWLFQENDGQRLVVAARIAMVVLLLATLLCIYAMGRMLLGPAAGLFALALAALCPTMLAHGRLVTTDMPATLAFWAVVLAHARLFEKVTVLRAALAALALAACAVTKFSWPIVLPALLAMACVALLRRAPLVFRVSRRPRDPAAPREREVQRLPHRLLAIGAWASISAVIAWLGIWTCYGWRYSPLRGADAAVAHFRPPPYVQGAATMDAAWQAVQRDYRGQLIEGVIPTLVSFARGGHLLPEAYLYGLAFTAATTSARGAYLAGRFYVEGSPLYFPIAFVIKTPIATMLLFLMGAAALLLRRMRSASALLLVGLLAFAATYAATVLASGINIGHRHLLPLYPAIFVIAGAAVAWWSSRAGKIVIVALVSWLAIANLLAFPHYLSYFNELIGGSKNGHLYLADSNIDWGQDLLRLADYARRHPNEHIKLHYFGVADPVAYVPNCEQLLPRIALKTKFAKFDAGTYVISVTELLGVYLPPVRDEFWADPVQKKIYAEQFNAYHGLLLAPADKFPLKPAAAQQFAMLRLARLLCRLRAREPDERIGYSLFVYRLTQKEVEEMMQPP